MRRTGICAVLTLAASVAAADDFSGRGQVSFQKYDFGGRIESGLRQSYNVGLDRGFTGTSRLRVFFRADDFQGSTERTLSAFTEKSQSRQYQPAVELLVDTDTLRILLRGDYLADRSQRGELQTERATERSFANLRWDPVGLPSLMVIAQRNATKEGAAQTAGTDESASAILQYPWRGLTTSAEARYVRSADDRVGYERSMKSYGASAGYAYATPGGRFSLSADASALQSISDERATGAEATLVPIPVPISRAVYGVDETPADTRDPALSPHPALDDGDINTSAAIALGPDGVSFQNIGFEIGRTERVDEVRIIVRDPVGNPLRTGGGPVTWDAYISEDGLLWRPLPGVTSSFDDIRSLYSITFEPVLARWLKVVNFGVNSEATLVTEAQAFFHRIVAPGGGRNGDQQSWNAGLALSFRPFRRLTLAYAGSYSALNQNYAAFASTGSTSGDHRASADYALARLWSLRGHFTTRDVHTYDGAGERSDTWLTALEYTPTRRLQLTAETSRQTQTLLGVPNTIDTVALRAYGQALRSVSFTLDLGMQGQTIEGQSLPARRTFLNLSSAARLTRTTRLQVSAAHQSAVSQSNDPATVLLGPTRDDRLYGELIWQPGRPLLVNARIGYVSGETISGMTQRLRVEWRPFGGGTVSLAGTWDEDIDPMSDRRARRVIFSPRWAMNRFVTVDVNYTAVATAIGPTTDEQKTLFATVTVTR